MSRITWFLQIGARSSYKKFQSTVEAIYPQTGPTLERTKTRMDARRGWAGILFFVLVFFAGDRLMGLVLDQLLWHSGNRFARLYRGEAPADVLILGNSRAVNSFYAPEIAKRYDCRCINLAYNGMSPDVILALLEDYLERHQAPKLVLLEATCVENKSLCVVNYKPFWRHSNRLTAIARHVAPASAVASRLSRLYDFNCEMYLRVLSHLRTNDQAWINRTTIDPKLTELTGSMTDRSMSPISDAELHSLTTLMRVIEQHGIECQMIVAPYLPAYRRHLMNFDEWKSHLELALGGKAIIDLSELLYETSQFADRLHTNLRGSGKILDELQRRGVFQVLLPDRSENFQ